MANRGTAETKQTGELGQTLLTAVERITDGNAEILALVARLRGPDGAEVDQHAQRVISHFSNKSAVVGGATALPGMLPGVGTAATLLAGPLTDMVFLLKYETELCLALSAVHGFDINQPAERQLAFLLAALKTAELHQDRSVICDGVEITAASIYHYGPRRIGKFLTLLMTSLAAVSLSKSLLRALPLIGIVVGAGMNKVLTRRVGNQAHEELRRRRAFATAPAHAP